MPRANSTESLQISSGTRSVPSTKRKSRVRFSRMMTAAFAGIIAGLVGTYQLLNLPPASTPTDAAAGQVTAALRVSRAVSRASGAAPGASGVEPGELAGGGLSLPPLAGLPGEAAIDDAKTGASATAENKLRPGQVTSPLNAPELLNAPGASARELTPAADTIPAPADRSADNSARVRRASAVSLVQENTNESQTLRLMQQLQDGNPAVRKAAESALRSQGFSARQLTLARQLTSNNPAERLKLVELLPSEPSVRGRDWLEWLLGDEDPEVRLATIGVLATMGDEALLRRLEQIARQDSDPQVQQQAEQLSAMRGVRK